MGPRQGRVSGHPSVPPVRVSGRFLELTGTVRRLRSARSGQNTRDLAARPDVPARLQLVVPKRLVRAALRRNTVKRVLREAWRAVLADAFPAAGRIWRFRLKAHPAGSLMAKSQFARARLRLAARRAVDRLAPGQGGKPSLTPPVPGSGPVMGFASSKRCLREEADWLLGQARCRLEQPGPAIRRNPAGQTR